MLTVKEDANNFKKFIRHNKISLSLSLSPGNFSRVLWLVLPQVQKENYSASIFELSEKLPAIGSALSSFFSFPSDFHVLTVKIFLRIFV